MFEDMDHSSGDNAQCQPHEEPTVHGDDDDDDCQVLPFNESEIIEIEDTDDELDETTNSSFLSAVKILKPTEIQKLQSKVNEFKDTQITMVSKQELKSIDRICKFFGVQIDPTWSLQKIRNLFSEKTEDHQRTPELENLLARPLVRFRSKAIHIEQLPQWFQNYHVMTLISLMSEFDVNRDTYYIEMFKDEQNKNTGECLVRFLYVNDCLTVLCDMQGLHVFKKFIKVSLDVGNKISRMQDKIHINNLKSLGIKKVKKLNVVVQEYIKHFRQELKQMRKFGNINDDGVVEVEDTDDECDDDNVNCNDTGISIKIHDDSTHLIKSVEEMMITDLADDKNDLESISNDKNDLETTSNVELGPIDKIHEQASEETKENIDDNIVIYEDREGAPVIKEDINNCRYISIDNIPMKHGHPVIKDLIKRKTGQVPIYSSRKAHKVYYLRFETHEDAVKVRDAINGATVQDKKIEVKLALGGQKWFQKFIRDPNKVKRKMGVDDDSELAKRSKTEGTATASADDSIPAYMPPAERTHDTYGLSEEFLNKLDIKPPLNSTVVISNLHPEMEKAKLFEVFSLAGEVKNINETITLEKEDIVEYSAKIEFDHPVEAVQAISLFHNQTLYDKVITVKMDSSWEERPLPSGLLSVGKGFGKDGEPLRDVRTIILKRKFYETFVEAGTMETQETLDETMPFEYTYTKLKEDLCNTQNKTDDISKSTETESAPSDMSKKTDDDDDIKELRAALESRGAIPARSNYEDLNSIIKALKTKATRTEPPNKPTDFNQKLESNANVKFGPRSANVLNTTRNSNFRNPNAINVVPSSNILPPHPSNCPNIAPNLLPNPNNTQNLSSNMTHFNITSNFQFNASNIGGFRQSMPNLMQTLGPNNYCPNKPNRLARTHHQDPLSSPGAENAIKEAALLYRNPSDSRSNFNHNKNRNSRSETNPNSVQQSRGMVQNMRKPFDKNSFKQNQSHFDNLSDWPNQPSYLYSERQSQHQYDNLRDGPNQSSYSQKRQSQQQCDYSRERSKDPSYSQDRHSNQQYDDSREWPNQPPYSQEKQLQTQYDNINNSREWPNQSFYSQERQSQQQYDNSKEWPNQSSYSQKRQSQQQYDSSREWLNQSSCSPERQSQQKYDDSKEWSNQSSYSQERQSQQQYDISREWPNQSSYSQERQSQQQYDNSREWPNQSSYCQERQLQQQYDNSREWPNQSSYSQERQSQQHCDNFREMPRQLNDFIQRHSEQECNKNSYKPERESSKVKNTSKENQNKSGHEKSDMLIFKNLPRSVSEQALSSKLSEVGELLCCTLTGSGRAVVRYKNIKDAERCYRLFNRSKVDSQVIEVNLM